MAFQFGAMLVPFSASMLQYISGAGYETIISEGGTLGGGGGRFTSHNVSLIFPRYKIWSACGASDNRTSS